MWLTLRLRLVVPSLLFSLCFGLQTVPAQAVEAKTDSPKQSPSTSQSDDADLIAQFEQALAGKPTTFADRPFTSDDRAKQFAICWSAYRAAAQKLGWDQMPKSWPAPAKTPTLTQVVGEIPADKEKMPYVLLTKGDKPANGWPLYFQMHGGGSTDEKLSGPHGWRVNTRDWNVQSKLIERAFPGGRYFVPRMANDNRGRWWYRHNMSAFDTVIRRAILFQNVDPNRVYMMGISEGAYGTEALTPFWADRLAGGAAMAGGAGAGERLLCLRNTAMRSDTGENDTMYGRAKLATEMHDYLAKQRAVDPTGYDHELNLQKGRGHGIDYRPSVEWLAQKSRQPKPAKLAWFNFALDGLRRTDFAWLALSKAPTQDCLIKAEHSRDNNTITISAMMNPPGSENESPVYAKPSPKIDKRVPLTGLDLIIHLDDAMLNLDRDVKVTVNDKIVHEGPVKRSTAVLAETMASTGDPGRIFTSRIVAPLK